MEKEMVNLNETKLNQVAATAMNAVGSDKRWRNAITRAAALLTSGNPYIHFTGKSLLILSDSGEIYESNGVCQCKAYPMPCKHRAAYKLVKRYLEAV
jgi:hypothetical protein